MERSAATVEPRAYPLDYAASDHEWVCPLTGVRIQKRLKEALAQRVYVWDKFNSSTRARGIILEQCRQSFLVWLNLFGWTYRQHEIMPDGSARPVKHAHVPFITWPVQDDMANEINKAIDGQTNLLIDKSRNMGASWVVLANFVWRFTFRPESAFLVLSRKEEEVDSSDTKPNMSTLFWKARYMLNRLPDVMRPQYGSSRLYLTNPHNGAIVKGESTNSNAGRSGRNQGTLIDEAAAVDNLEEIMGASHEATFCRILVSTPIGPCHYSDLRFSGRIKVFECGWWNHPEKGRDRRIIVNRGRQIWHGGFRQKQLNEVGERIVAQNLDIDHEASGSVFFDLNVLAFQKQTYATDPLVTGRLVWKVSGADRDEAIATGNLEHVRFRGDADGELRLWVPLTKVNGRLRPPQDRRYVFGADISMGTGASLSAVTILDAETGQQVAEWTSATVDPAEFAVTVATLGYWFGCRSEDPDFPDPLGCAFVCWETNGGGGQLFTRRIRQLAYPWLYREKRGTKAAKKSTREVEGWGWTNNPATNLDSLSVLRTAMATGECVVRSLETLDEAGKYIFLPTGNVGPAALQNEGKDAHATHGDRLRSLAIAWVARRQMARIRPAEVKAPFGSRAYWLEALHPEPDDGGEDE